MSNEDERRVRLNNIWPGSGRDRRERKGREREKERDVPRDGELDDEGGGSRGVSF